MATKMVDEVELGFLEETSNSNQTTSNFFPSKVGGKPVWLDPVHLPIPEHLQCLHCHKPCLLLLQMYAPVSDQPETYHRSLFIFMCPDSNCHKQKGHLPFRVLRCHLPRGNPYYPSDGAEPGHVILPDEDLSRPYAVPSPLCCVCGSPAPNRCGQCRKVHYCSRHHQLLDWKREHKNICKELIDTIKCRDPMVVTGIADMLWTEYEIVTETEPPLSSPSQETRMAAYTSYINSTAYKKLPEDVEDELTRDLLNTSIKEDKTFSKFKERISLEPEQVIRFQPGGDPLLMSSDQSQMPPSVIPQCEKCQSSRQFECQIMPQLLYYLKLDYWGTLMIYTCSSNCFSTPGYTEEFLWKQDPL